MENQDNKLQDKLVRQFADFEKNWNGSVSEHFRNLRKEAIHHFGRMGFPTTRQESWKYTNIKPATANAYESAVDPPEPISRDAIAPYLLPETCRLVFVNGQFQPDLSEIPELSAQMVVQPLSRAFKEHPELLEEHFARYGKYEGSSLTALNTAYADGGTFIYIPDQTISEHPVHLIYLTDGRSGHRISYPRNLVVAGKNSQVKLIETSASTGGEACFVNAVNEVRVMDHAHVEWFKVQEENLLDFHVDHAFVNQDQNSYCKIHTVTTGSAITRNDLNITLNGSGCETHLYGLYWLGSKQHVDNHTLIDHARANSYSNELYKGIMDGQSTGVFNGKVMVRQDAQKTNAFQSNKNILLSDEATINAKPELEIYADDVKCSHGATSGQLDEQSLFYLKSRGIDPGKAAALLTFAFASEVLEHISVEPLKQYLSEKIQQRTGIAW